MTQIDVKRIVSTVLLGLMIGIPMSIAFVELSKEEQPTVTTYGLKQLATPSEKETHGQFVMIAGFGSGSVDSDLTYYYVFYILTGSGSYQMVKIPTDCAVVSETDEQPTAVNVVLDGLTSRGDSICYHGTWQLNIPKGSINSNFDPNIGS